MKILAKKFRETVNAIHVHVRQFDCWPGGAPVKDLSDVLNQKELKKLALYERSIVSQEKLHSAAFEDYKKAQRHREFVEAHLEKEHIAHQLHREAMQSLSERSNELMASIVGILREALEAEKP